MSFKRKLITASFGVVIASNSIAEEITIATVNNADMITMQELSPAWEDATGNTINWVVLEENLLRQSITTDIALGLSSFDIIFIGAYETPIWGRKGWLTPLNDFADDVDYDLNDVFPVVRNSLSANGNLYALPLYSETSFTFYRTDLFEDAGLAVPTSQPTYTEFAEMAAKLHDPENDIYGTCLRGKAGWGDNMAFVGTVANAFGAKWFDMNWHPQLDSPEWNATVNYYVNLLRNSGPPQASENGHNENRALFKAGRCATWIDATSAAGDVRNPDVSAVADVTDFFEAPRQVTDKGTGWFWSWALAIPASAEKTTEARSFLKWATSKDYFALVGDTKGWVAVPSGARASVEADERRLEAAPFSNDIVNAIWGVDPTDPTRDPVPYTGVQFVAIEEFQRIGDYVGEQVSAVLLGQSTVEEALANSQAYALQEMDKAGYFE